MRRILVLLSLLVATVCMGQQSVQQCILPTAVSSGTTTQRVNVPNLNTTPAATAGIGAWGFTVKEPCTTNGIAYEPLAADTSGGSATDKFVVGLYCISGNCVAGSLYATTGEMSAATFAPAGNLNTVITQSWVTANQGPPPVTLPAGLYALSFGVNGCTSTTTCPIISAESGGGQMYPFFAQNIVAYSSGLPLTLGSLPSISPTSNNVTGTLSIPQMFIY